MMGQPLEHIGLLLGLLGFALLFYSVFAFVRDIVCTTICPYGRLQSVLFDPDTMQIAYDHKRGEPRGKYNKNATRTFGDCIDCKKCVQVCPTGIDIRNGVQMECVGCTACIDACDAVMEKLSFPKGLIRYASENEINTGRKFRFNNRMKAYTALLVLLSALMIGLVATRKTIDVYVSRARGQLFQETSDNKISNLYEAKIINKTNKDLPISLQLDGIDNGAIRLVGNPDIVLKKESINEITFFVDIPKEQVVQRSSHIALSVYSGERHIQTVETKFLGPFQ